MENHKRLIEVLKSIPALNDDKWNPETYVNMRRETGNDHSFGWSFLLGNFYLLGYSSETKFEIFKDHSGWQVWAWHWKGTKQENNQFNAPYYKVEELIKFISTNI